MVWSISMTPSTPTEESHRWMLCVTAAALGAELAAIAAGAPSRAMDAAARQVAAVRVGTILIWVLGSSVV